MSLGNLSYSSIFSSLYLANIYVLISITLYRLTHRLRKKVPVPSPALCQWFVQHATNPEQSPQVKEPEKEEKQEGSLMTQVDNYIKKLCKRVHFCGQEEDCDLNHSTSSPNTFTSLHFSTCSRRRDLAITFFYSVLERMLTQESLRCKKQHKPVNFSKLLHDLQFHSSLMVLCLELVAFAYRVRSLKWPLVFLQLNAQAWTFLRVLESVIRIETDLPTAIQQHFSFIEKELIELYVWRFTEPLQLHLSDISHRNWLRTQLCPNITSNNSNSSSNLSSSLSSTSSSHNSNTSISKKLSLTSVSNPKHSNHSHTQSSSNDLIPIPSSSSSSSSSSSVSSVSKHIVKSSLVTNNHPSPASIRFSLSVFFRKVSAYSEKWLLYMCGELGVVDALVDDVWHFLQSVLAEHIELLLDRHLHTVLLCCIYAICNKVARNAELNFRKIIGVYLSRWELHSAVVCREIPSNVPISQQNLSNSTNTLAIVSFYNQIFIPACKDLLPSVTTTAEPIPSPGLRGMEAGVPLVSHFSLLSGHSKIALTSNRRQLFEIYDNSSAQKKNDQGQTGSQLQPHTNRARVLVSLSPLTSRKVRSQQQHSRKVLLMPNLGESPQSIRNPHHNHYNNTMTSHHPTRPASHNRRLFGQATIPVSGIGRGSEQLASALQLTQPSEVPQRNGIKKALTRTHSEVGAEEQENNVNTNSKRHRLNDELTEPE